MSIAVSGWASSKVRYLADYINGAIFKPESWSNSGLPIIRIQNLTDSAAGFNYFDGVLPAKYRVTAGDILLPWSASPGVYIWRGPEAWLNQHIFRVVPRRDIVSPSYFYWLATWFIPEMEHRLHGSTMQHFTWDLFASFEVPLPPADEQRAISDFLDRETAEADALVAKYERLIKLLEEKRDALITQVTTKGLRTDVRTRVTGIPYIGEIPRRWATAPLKRLVSTKITDGPHETPELVDDGVPFISAEAVRNSQIDFSHARGFISANLHAAYSRKCRPVKKDIFMVKSGNTTGATAFLAAEVEFSIWSPLALIRAEPSTVLPEYLFLSLNSRSFQDAVSLFSSYGTQPNIGMSVIENLKIAVPPLDEQIAILETVKHEDAKDALAIARASDALSLLRERRASLITAAVTGHIDIRTYGKPKPFIEVAV